MGKVTQTHLSIQHYTTFPHHVTGNDCGCLVWYPDRTTYIYLCYNAIWRKFSTPCIYLHFIYNFKVFNLICRKNILKYNFKNNNSNNNTFSKGSLSFVVMPSTWISWYGAMRWRVVGCCVPWILGIFKIKGNKLLYTFSWADECQRVTKGWTFWFSFFLKYVCSFVYLILFWDLRKFSNKAK